MCGIIFTNLKVNQDKFKRSTEYLKKRGPDNLTIDQFANYKIAHSRLAIIDDNENSNQPMYSQDKKDFLIFNGEIYNYLQLKNKYQITTKTNSDTEVLLCLLKKFAENIIPELNGMFAFVYYSINKNKMIVCRDRLGIKPLYYSNINGKLIFSSMLSPILELIDNNEIDEIGLRQYKKMRTFFRGHTLYKNVKEFPAGHYFNGEKFIKYWDIDNQCDQSKKINDDKLKEIIIDSVNLRTSTSKPCTSLLSGGIDSFIISKLAKVKDTWSVGIAMNNEFNEASYSAKILLTDHYNIEISNEDFINHSLQLLKNTKKTISVKNEVLLHYLLCKIRSEKDYKIILSGEGADELFFGYDRIFRWANNNQKLNLKEFDEYYSYSDHEDMEIVEYCLEPYLENNTTLDIVKKFFQIDHLRGLLLRLDNASMEASMEARVPFCDHRLVEYMYNKDYSERTNDSNSKFILKKIFSDILDDEIINRKKIGFPVDLNKIFNKKTSHLNWVDFNLMHL